MRPLLSLFVAVLTAACTVEPTSLLAEGGSKLYVRFKDGTPTDTAIREAVQASDLKRVETVGMAAAADLSRRVGTPLRYTGTTGSAIIFDTDGRPGLEKVISRLPDIKYVEPEGPLLTPQSPLVR